MKLAGLVACLAASAVVGWVPQRVVRVTALVRQATVPSGGSVLCVGNGPVLLMAAKRAALEGFDTSIIGGGSTELYESLLYEDAGDYEARIPNLKILGGGVVGSWGGCCCQLSPHASRLTLAAARRCPLHPAAAL